MTLRLVFLVVLVSLGLTIFGAIAQGTPIISLPSKTESGLPSVDPDMDTILSYIQGWQSNPLGMIPNVSAHVRYFGALFHLAIQQGSLKAAIPADTPWVWTWIILWIPVIAMVVFGVILLFISILQRFFTA